MGSSVGKALAIAGMVVGAVALIATGAGLIVGAAAVTAFLGGVSAATLTAVAGALAIGGSLLSPRPKPPGIGDATLSRFEVSLDLNTPRKAVFGNTAMALDLRDQEIENIAGTEDDLNIHRWIVMAAHKIESLDELWMDGEKVWTLSGGVIKAEYQDFLTVTVVKEGSASNYINYGGRIPASSRRYTGCAYFYLKFFINSESPFMNAIPTRMTARGKAMPTYDPRKDSTNGGSGSQRPDNNATWAYGTGTTPQGQNLALQLLSWLLGWKINGVLSVGKGIPADRIDLASFITAANECDELVTKAAGGSEPRYHGGGIVSEGEEMTSTIGRWKAAMNADLDDVDGKIRCTVFVNDLGAPVLTLTHEDVQDDFQWHPSTSLPADYNIVTGAYVNPSDTALYQMTPYPDVKLTSRDGINRIETVDYSMVQSQSQAERLSKQRLQRAQYPGTFSAVFDFRAHGCQKGDIVLLNFWPVSLDNVPFRVIEKEYRGDGFVPMTLRLENAAIYAWDNDDSAQVQYAAPMLYSSMVTPFARLTDGAWLPPSSGAQDANLLKDPQFSYTHWSRESGTHCKRVRGTYTFSGRFPLGSVQTWVGQIQLGVNATRSFKYDKKNLPTIEVGRIYYAVVSVAKAASNISGSATLRLRLRFINNSGAAVGANVDKDITLAALLSGGAWTTIVCSGPAPAGATKAIVECMVLSNTAVGYVRFDNPKLLDKEPGADVTLSISGPTSLSFTYDYQGNLDPSAQLPTTLAWKLNTPAGQVTSGISWKLKVVTGTLNGLTSTNGEQAMTGSGTGQYTVNSLGTDTVDVDVYADYNGKRIGPYRTKLLKDIADPPVDSGGGGGGGGNIITQTSGFSSYSGTSFVPVTQVFALTPGGTVADLVATLNGTPTTTGGADTWTSEFKWQQESSPGSGTWNDVTTAKVSDSSRIEGGGASGDPLYVSDVAALTLTVQATGLTAGAVTNFRGVARLVSGSRPHAVSGTASVEG